VRQENKIADEIGFDNNLQKRFKRPANAGRFIAAEGKWLKRDILLENCHIAITAAL